MPQLDIKVEAERLRSLYKENPAKRKLHALILGEKGAGKTYLALTCPKPVLIHSFDPGGTEVLSEAIDAGDIIADTRFEVDSPASPRAFLAWQAEFNHLGQGGVFNDIGTYIIDSTTTLSDCLLWQILAKEGRILPNMKTKLDPSAKGMRWVDWGTYLNVFIMLSRSLGALPCHTILLGHLGRDKDEVTQRYIRGLMLPGQSSEKVPINLHELYVLQVKPAGEELARTLLTQNDGEYRATTRMGRAGKFGKEEPPDIRALLKKAGYPYEDKPKI